MVQVAESVDKVEDVANKAKSSAPITQKRSTTAEPGHDHTNPWDSPPRSGSAPRGGAKRGAWREALGPEKLVGFTKYRKANN